MRCAARDGTQGRLELYDTSKPLDPLTQGAMPGRSSKWQQPTFNHPPKHYRGCLDKTRMAGNPQLDYDINGKPVRPEDFMYQIATRNKYGRGVSDHKGSASGVGKSLQRAHDAANFHLETARLKQEGARSADPAVRRHWELQPGLINFAQQPGRDA